MDNLELTISEWDVTVTNISITSMMLERFKSEPKNDDKKESPIHDRKDLKFVKTERKWKFSRKPWKWFRKEQTRVYQEVSRHENLWDEKRETIDLIIYLMWIKSLDNTPALRHFDESFIRHWTKQTINNQNEILRRVNFEQLQFNNSSKTSSDVWQISYFLCEELLDLAPIIEWKLDVK